MIIHSEEGSEMVWTNMLGMKIMMMRKKKEMRMMEALNILMEKKGESSSDRTKLWTLLRRRLGT